MFWDKVSGVYDLFENKKQHGCIFENNYIYGYSKGIHLEENVKSMINDGDIINRLLEDDIETYNSLLERINGCTTRLHRMKKSIKLIFRIYKSLLNNYNIYEQAIVKYTDLALESVFNIGNSYEIC